MSAEVQTASSPTSSAAAAGTVIGDRFRVEGIIQTTPLWTVLRAEDTQAQGAALVWLLALDDAGEALADAAGARGLSHDHLAPLLEFGMHEGRPYLAYAYVSGHPLRKLLERKQATGGAPFSPKVSFTLVSQAAAAVEALAGEAHGLIGLDTVFVDQNGHVMLFGAGLAPFAPLAVRASLLPDSPAIAPEVAKGQVPGVAADIYSLGALSYYTLVGSDPVKGCRRPSEVVPGVKASLDTMVGMSMNPNPAQRYTSARDLTQAFQDAIQSAGGMSGAMPVQPRPAGARPSLAQSIAAAPDPEESSGVGTALAMALADTEERFLINMGNLDYGPFTLQQVVDRIRGGEIVHGHIIIDKDTGNRQKVEDNLLLADLVEEARERRDEQRRAQAEVAHASQEKRRGFALYGFILLGVAALGGGAYFLVSKLAADKSEGRTGEVASLDQGDLKVKITPISVGAKGGGKGKRSGKRSGGPDGVAGGWDDSQSLDMSDDSGGSERLDGSQINPVIQRNGGSLGRCLTSTGSRYADIDFIIKGDGRVSHVRVNGETGGALANCVRGAMKKMQFPPFNGSRTKANFNMSL